MKKLLVLEGNHDHDEDKEAYSDLVIEVNKIPVAHGNAKSANLTQETFEIFFVSDFFAILDLIYMCTKESYLPHLMFSKQYLEAPCANLVTTKWDFWTGSLRVKFSRFVCHNGT